MMRGLERRLVENLCNSGATMPSRMNLCEEEFLIKLLSKRPGLSFKDTMSDESRRSIG